MIWQFTQICQCEKGINWNFIMNRTVVSQPAIQLYIRAYIQTDRHVYRIGCTPVHTRSKSEGFDSRDRPSNLTEIGFKSSIFQPVWPWNLMDDLEKNKAPLLFYIKLCASFQIHWWIQTGVGVQKRSFRVKIGNFMSCVTLKFDGWPWKTIGHLFYTTSSFVHRFTAMG